MAKVRLGADLADMRGEVGNEIYSKSRSGPVKRAQPKYRFPVSPGQRVTANTFQMASQVFNTLTRTEFLAWDAYARSLSHYNAVTGRQYKPTAMNVFLGLTCKFLQVNPDVDPPRTPPTSPFLGDTITLTAAAASESVRFTASGANTGTTLTELLLQKLKNARQTPTKTFLSQDFVAFTGILHGSFVFVEAGIYVPAYRFVNPTTGQMTELKVLPEVTVA